MSYDVILIHPPAIYDFRKKPIFPGPLGSTVESVQFAKVPVGMLSMADYLDRHGYRVMVDNLADRMVDEECFDAEEHIRNSSARVYGIDLHFHHHAQGAIEVAQLCKKLHPDSLVVLGGLTATYFHEEIILKYHFVDAVIRGEGEKPLLQLVRAYEKNGRITKTPSLTYRTDAGAVCITPLMEASTSLDEFEFIRFDLLEPKISVLPPGIRPRWSISVCRGCRYNCVTCGGSAYSYKTYCGMKKPSFRSAERIISDMRRLNEQGIKFMGLYQDPRMGGEKYWKELMAALRREKSNIERLSLDLLAPADEEFVREVSTIGNRVVLQICPDTGDYNVRRAQGRLYSNEDLLNTVKLCHKYHIPVTTFLSIGLAGESQETSKETWKLWDNLCSLDQVALEKGSFGKDINQRVPLGGPIIGPIILEPGSLSFDFPEKYGYRLSFSNLEGYIQALSKPSWHQWLNYETKQLNRDALVKLIFESVEHSIRQRAKYGVYDDLQFTKELLKARADMIAVGAVNRIMEIQNEAERESRLKSLRSAIDSVFNPSSREHDLYGYREMIENTVLVNRLV
jgi:B12-binding domain/radical SAM domain protein